MNNTYFFNRFLAEDVQTAELQMEYSKALKHVQAKVQPTINKKEVQAEAIWERMYGKKAA